MNKSAKIFSSLFVLSFIIGLVSDRVAGQANDSSLLLIDNNALNIDPSPKISGHLLNLHAEYQEHLAANANAAILPDFQSANPVNRVVNVAGKDFVVVDAVAQEDARLLQRELIELGLENSSVYGRVVSGYLPLLAIKNMETVVGLNYVRPATAITHVGAVDSQGDAAQKSDVARTTYSVDGTGITIGTLSDSYNCLGGAAADVASGDLPVGVNVLDDSACAASDEGRGMMQLIMDAAPGASQAFHTAFTGQAGFATGITDLAAAGADVIVDDVFYYTEPMFQDGIIAQAVDTVVASGVSYFSSAGNQSRQAYESAFNASGQFPLSLGEEAHDFDPGAGVDIYQSITIPNGSTNFSFQWNSPYFSVSGAPGSTNDLNFYIVNDSGTAVLLGSADSNVGNDPIEFLGVTNSGAAANYNLLITKAAGADPGFMKYAYFNSALTVNEYDTASGTLFGHSNAVGTEAVGAAFYYQTPVFGTNPPLLEAFSSAGTTPIFFDTSGNPVTETRAKPRIVAPDGGNTTFFGSDIPDFGGTDPDTFPNFFGTSAAAPHAAAVSALLLERAGATGLTPTAQYAVLEGTTIDMGAAGFDDDTGYGLIQADIAVADLPADFSDLDASYMAAWHGGGGILKLGSAWDADSNFDLAQDDGNDDGVVRDVNAAWTPGTSNGLLDVTVAGCSAPPCRLNGWVDWDMDGVFDSGDQILTDTAVSNGTTQDIAVTIPGTAPCLSAGTCKARFRLTSGSGIAATGPASDGEVSDYVWSFAPTAVTISGSTTGSTGTIYDFEAAVTPLYATTPVTYTWEATDQTPVVVASSANLTDTTSFNWPTMGTKTITVTAESSLATVTDVHEIVINTVSGPQPPTAVTITGILTGTLGVDYSFEAAVSPISTTLPLTYTWQTPGETSVVHVTSNLTDTVTFNWDSAGDKVVTVTVENAVGSVNDDYTIAIRYFVYLPIVMRD